MQGIVKAIFSRTTLALLLLVLVCTALWFVGPLLSFGGLRPLEGAGMRVTVIALLLVLALFLLLDWPVSMVGVVALALLLWHAGPLLAFGPLHPLEPVWVRALMVAGLLFVYALWGGYQLLQAIQNDRELLGRILRPGRAPAQALAREEIKAMRGLAAQAVSQLKHMRSRAGALRRLLEGKRYLYVLPWYMIIGKPGAGKTTALLNSGLQFPLASQMGSAAALAGDTGTLNCAWWFTNEAVLVDTAGRFTDQLDGQLPPGAVSSAGAPGALAEPASGEAASAGAGTGSAPAQPRAAPASQAQVNAAEWRGFLGVLRKVRPRAPINGALLAVDARELIEADAGQRLAQAAHLRERLQELRDELGVRFPVYVLVTKCDALSGFNEYFSPLTTEGRAQVWGLSLPWQARPKWRLWKRRSQAGAAPASAALQAAGGETAKTTSVLAGALQAQLQALRLRIADGVAARLQEEFEVERRQRLYALPHELAGLEPALVHLLDAVFAESRFDASEASHGLRGVYFTSAAQELAPAHAARAGVESGAPIRPRAEAGSVISRLMSALGRTRSAQDGVPGPSDPRPAGQRSYFLADLLTRVVFPESHLVRPNLRWEARQRLVGWIGHALVLLAFVWLAGALMLSHRNNLDYLGAVGRKAAALRGQVEALFADFKAQAVPEALTAAQDLPQHFGLDLQSPAGSYRYGLYSAEPIALAGAQTYASLQDQLLLPSIVHRLETLLAQAVAAQDAKTAYDTLRVYLMLHDKERFNAADLRAWVVADWQAAQGISAMFGGKAAMLGHLESLFSGERVVQSGTVANAALVRQARAYLDGTTTSERLYERAKVALAGQAPPDFTLIRAIGPQAGTVFARQSGAPLEQGVPGLFTYDGYHQLFARRLPEMVALARQDDAWVMGRGEAGGDALSKKNFDAALALTQSLSLAEDIRRQYLAEYTRQWTAFLEDIRVLSGANLAFDLNVLRQLAAPDSPLARLARAAARETTLSRALQAKAEEDKSLLDKAGEQFDKKAREVSKGLGLRAEARLEKSLVDDRFGALREIVTGQSDAVAAGASFGQAGASKAVALEGITGLINEFYTVLVVADTALAAGTVPPGAADAGARMRLEAGRLPAPFKEVLTGLGAAGADKVVQGAQGVLKVQAQAQLDRLNGLMALQLSEPCRRALEGKYPFTTAPRGAAVPDVSIEDFQQLFAAGGALDDYFSKHLAPYVDTSARPWRYKHPATANMLTPADAAGNAPAPATLGPTLGGELLKLLAASGPNPDVFARAAQIREVFFREAGARRMTWKMDIRVSELEPSITELVMDLDGQGQRYAHGPVQPWQVSWPGPRGGASAELIANPRIKRETSGIQTSGPWALLKLIESGRIVSTATSGRVAVEYLFDGRRAVLDIGSQAILPNPLTTDLLRGFSCPGGPS